MQVKARLPLFEDGTCFLLGADGRIHAYHVFSKNDKEFTAFRNGLSFTVRYDDPRIRTGFEEDFPTIDQIDWGRSGKPFRTQSPEAEAAELEANRMQRQRLEFLDWESEDYSPKYSDLANEDDLYKEFLQWERFCFSSLGHEQLELALMF